MAYISRDPFAREELHRRTVPNKSGGCDNCGNTNRHGKLFKYYIEADGLTNRTHDIDGKFCSVGCMRSYHG